ncbi:hypothetical protein A2U01_0079261, partial [Trifolium medium]|nr:hypothetical protein [Trifolium medium]
MVTMLLNVGFQNRFVSTVRSRAILLGIARHQGLNQQRLQHKEVDPLLEDVSTHGHG